VGEAEPLLPDGPARGPRDWSLDGELLAFEEGSEQGKGADIWFLSMESPGKAEPFLATSFDERAPRFSPDGRVVAYSSDESGNLEVYVVTSGGGRRQILSSGGGAEPVWARNGRELFYRQGHRMMVVPTASEEALVTSKAQVLFEGPFEFNIRRIPNYDVSPDGSRFVMIEGPAGGRPGRINVVSGWLEEQTRRRNR
jgi:Tol biopolymer transport system component